MNKLYKSPGGVMQRGGYYDYIWTYSAGWYFVDQHILVKLENAGKSNKQKTEPDRVSYEVRNADKGRGRPDILWSKSRGFQVSRRIPKNRPEDPEIWARYVADAQEAVRLFRDELL